MGSYQKFLDENKEYDTSMADYIHLVLMLKKIHIDLIKCFFELMYPNFKLINDRLFLANFFESKMFDDYINQNLPFNEIQFWQNLIEITGLFEELEIEDALKIADILVETWNLKIQKEFGFDHGKARSFYDEELGEVFITID